MTYQNKQKTVQGKSMYLLDTNLAQAFYKKTNKRLYKASQETS